MEIAVSDQKSASVHIKCPREEIKDGKYNTLQTVDLVRFGSSNQSGDVSLDFIGQNSLTEEQKMEVLEDEKILITRGADFDANARCKISNKWISKIGLALGITEKVVMHLSEGYPLILELPIAENKGMLQWVVSPTLEDENEAEEEGGAKADDDGDLFAEDEDEFSDG